MTEKSIVEQPWDVLIILDACRFDFFSRCNHIPGALTRKTVDGSCTSDWLEKNFSQYEKLPITYVSGTPLINGVQIILNFLGAKHFQRVVDVWHFGWHEGLKTVPPWTLTDEALKHIEDRCIVHYMQPHTPYIGPHTFPIRTWEMHRDFVLDPTSSRHLKVPTILYNDSDIKQMRYAYQDNLVLALCEVNRLLTGIPKDKRVIISSDHGELLGEGRQFGHPCKKRYPVLLDVPWLEVDLTAVKERYHHYWTKKDADYDAMVATEKQRAQLRSAKSTIEEKLKALGYF